MLFENMKHIYGSIEKKGILVILGWSTLISLLAIKSYWLFYIQNLKFYVGKITFRYGQGPGYTAVDAILIIGVSFLIGMFFADAKTLVWTYITSIFLSFSMIVIYIFYYIWYVLDFATPLSLTAFGWEEILLIAIMNTLRFIFPWGIYLSLMGLVVGGFLRGTF
jgi:hypothetical protein